MTYRNRKLLDLAKQAPICFRCQRSNDGTVVMAHSNQIRDGKGTGHKAADYRVAGLCRKCHMEIDNGQSMSREDRMSAWEEAHRATIGWMFDAGLVEVVR